ncbi:MAG: acyl carrier protein [Rhodoplanes sp.]
MVEDLMEGLVIDVVLGVMNAETDDITRDSDFSDLGVDQLSITYIVLELEVRLGIELPADLEDTQTVAELAAGTRQALRAAAANQQPQGDELLQLQMRRPFLRRHSISYRHRSQPGRRPRRHPLTAQKPFLR